MDIYDSTALILPTHTQGVSTRGTYQDTADKAIKPVDLHLEYNVSIQCYMLVEVMDSRNCGKDPSISIVDAANDLLSTS